MEVTHLKIETLELKQQNDEDRASSLIFLNAKLLELEAFRLGNKQEKDGSCQNSLELIHYNVLLTPLTPSTEI